jgi:pimeloyl-ACP methyl ester carboxylesterase
MTMTNAAVVDILSRAPSFRFSLPFGNDSAKEVFSDDAASFTSLELEAKHELKPENNRLRALIEGLPAPSIPAIPGRPPTLPPPFAGLSSATADLNIVLLGGYRGSVLRSTHDDRMLWVPVKAGLGLRKVNLELSLTENGEAEACQSIKPDGMLTNIGPIDISRKLLKRLREAESQGFCKVHEFGYDWRLGGSTLSAQLIAFLDTLPGKSLVAAHSMGGLIAGHALNQRPDLFVCSSCFC